MVLCCAALTLATLSAQQPRDGAPIRPTPSGTAAIAGVVNDATASSTSPEPVRRAVVTLSGSSLPDAVSTVTDDAGRFAFERLPAGRFTLTASKASFLTQAYGARKPGQPGVAVPLTAGARESVLMSLTRGGVITGTVTDGQGKPLAGSVVRVLDVAQLDRRVSGNSIADDRGIYRIYGLASGRYFVVAQPRQAGEGELTTRSSAEIDAILARLRQGPGRVTPAAPRAADATAPASVHPVVLAPVFFPGTSSVDAATPIALRAGEERPGVDFVVAPVPSSEISGAISDGSAALGQLRVLLASAGVRLNATTPDTIGGEPISGGSPGRDGKFRFSNVAPGRYLLTASSRGDLSPDTPTSRQVSTRIGSPNPAPIPGAKWRFAQAELNVTGTDVTGIVLELGPGAVINGRVVAEGTPGGRPLDVRKLSISVSDPGAKAITMTGAFFGNRLPPPPSVTPDSDGRFIIPDIAPGDYQLRVTTPEGWMAETALADGRDLLDAPLALALGQSVVDVTIAVTAKRTELAGVLQDPAGFGVSDDIVIAIPVDRALWLTGSRRVQVAQPGKDGLFSITDLPPGDYFVGALTSLDAQLLYDPTFLEDVAAQGVRVTLRSGERTTQNLRLQR